jgi:hypothetical protein
MNGRDSAGNKKQRAKQRRMPPREIPTSSLRNWTTYSSQWGSIKVKLLRPKGRVILMRKNYTRLRGVWRRLGGRMQRR